jgi:hypothetical protein
VYARIGRKLGQSWIWTFEVEKTKDGLREIKDIQFMHEYSYRMVVVV